MGLKVNGEDFFTFEEFCALRRHKTDRREGHSTGSSTASENVLLAQTFEVMRNRGSIFRRQRKRVGQGL